MNLDVEVSDEESCIDWWLKPSQDVRTGGRIIVCEPHPCELCGAMHTRLATICDDCMRGILEHVAGLNLT